jgi:NADH:ubiquinone oxidoreductase subunit 2 (subunit N)
MTTGHRVVAALVLFATVVEAVYYLKFVAMIYSTDQKVKVFDSTLKFNKIVPVVLFALAIILFSLVPQFLDVFFNVLSRASRELTDVGSYISAVLGS